MINSEITTILEVYNNHEINTRAYNLCKYNEIFTVHELENYYKEHGSFHTFRGCGRISINELETICKKYGTLSNITEFKTTPTIYQLYVSNKIITNTFNICKNYDILTIDDLVNYYIKYGTFSTMTGCGNKTKLEMENLCKKYRKLPIIKVNTKTKNNKIDIVKIISELDTTQTRIINDIIYIEIDNLGKKLRNAIKAYIGEPLNIQSFSDKIFFYDEFRLEDIMDLKPTTLKSLIPFLEKIKMLTIKISLRDNQVF